RAFPVMTARVSGVVLVGRVKDTPSTWAAEGGEPGVVVPELAACWSTAAGVLAGFTVPAGGVLPAAIRIPRVPLSPPIRIPGVGAIRATGPAPHSPSPSRRLSTSSCARSRARAPAAVLMPVPPRGQGGRE